MNQSDAVRMKMERRIARSAINDLLAAGLAVTVFDGEENTLTDSTDADAIFNAMFTTDEDYLMVTLSNGGKSFVKSFVRFVYGNAGYEVINDYGVSLETILRPTLDLIDKLEAAE